jgi:hypothetical protein
MLSNSYNCITLGQLRAKEHIAYRSSNMGLNFSHSLACLEKQLQQRPALVELNVDYGASLPVAMMRRL